MGQYTETVRKFYGAWNRRDWNEITNCFATNIEYCDLPRGLTFHGQTECVNDLREWEAAFPDAKIEVGNIYECENTTVNEVWVRGTHKGPLGPLPATNKVCEMRICEVWEWTGNKVSRIRSYYDTYGMFCQLGFIPLTPPIPNK